MEMAATVEAPWATQVAGEVRVSLKHSAGSDPSPRRSPTRCRGRRSTSATMMRRHSSVRGETSETPAPAIDSQVSMDCPRNWPGASTSLRPFRPTFPRLPANSCPERRSTTRIPRHCSAGPTAWTPYAASCRTRSTGCPRAASSSSSSAAHSQRRQPSLPGAEQPRRGRTDCGARAAARRVRTQIDGHVGRYDAAAE